MVLFFCLICLPWYDYLLIVTYGINYLWAGTLAVWAAYCLLNADKYHSAAAGSVCFIAGWMHEGFGVPLSTAAIILLLTEHKNRGYSKLTILTIAGTCCTALTPAIWRRLFYMSTASGKEYPLSESLLHFGPIVALLVILAALLLKHTITNRRIWKDKRTIFYVVYILAASSLAFKFYCGPRITTSPVIFTFAGIMTLMPDLKLFSRRLFSKICASSIVAFSILHLSYAIHLQYRLQHQFDEIVRLFKASETGQLYINPIPMRADISLYKTTVRQFHESVPRTMFSRYYGRTTSKVMTILPERLQGFTPDKGTPSDYIKGLYIYNNCLVACSGIITDGRIIIILDSEKNRHETRIRLQKFKAADGNNYELVTPHTAILNPSLRIIDAEQ